MNIEDDITRELAYKERVLVGLIVSWKYEAER